MNSAEEQIFSGSSFITTISPTIRKALVEFWSDEDIIDQPGILVDLGPGNISRINRIDSRLLWQIAQALDSFGYIGSSHLWLLKKK